MSEKKYDDGIETQIIPHSDLEGAKYQQSNENEGYYDPSLESRWTRLGLNLESLKRAPGTTA
jgi:hypothetical protein